MANRQLMCLVLAAEFGDFSEDIADSTYLNGLKLLPQQTDDVDLKVIEHHKEHV